MRTIILFFCLLAAVEGKAQIVDSLFYGNIRAGMLKSDYDQNVSESRIRIINDEYALLPAFHNGQELISLDMQSEAEALENFSVIEKKLLTLYDVISTKYGRARSLTLVSEPGSIAEGNTRVISSWDIGLKHISIGAKNIGGKYVAVCNIYIKGYDEKLTDRDLAREEKMRQQAGKKF
ncbi:MAG: hypothetical protein JNL72_10660 [Flavipsychrobacter sp.]|nr:hypothetical protein [Flavipsychrobacter sp.]